MTVLRFLSSLFALVAAITFIADITPLLSGTGPFVATSLAKHWGDIAPATLQAAKTAVTRGASPWVWDPMIVSILGQPTFVLFGVLSILAGYAGRRRQRVRIDIN